MRVRVLGRLAKLAQSFRKVNARQLSVDYRNRLEAERNIYQDCVNVHDLPPIFHYWSHRYLRPKLEAFGFSNPYELFEKYTAQQCRRSSVKLNRFVSIGSGNCDMEVALARKLVDAGIENFSIECLDLNDAMLARGRQMAEEQHLRDKLEFTAGDFNNWMPVAKYDAVLANQALHHVLNLEGLFSAIKTALAPDGIFVVSDMIGRNGHMRWPEALEIVHEFWRLLPDSYRYNHQLQRHEKLYENWDCSKEGFEGIRSQDILPLLLKTFNFELFIAFANIIDPFVDRGFGHNFKAHEEWDQQFIDRVHERDETEIRSGHLKPTHMIAVLRNEPVAALGYHAPLTPEFCVRRP